MALLFGLGYANHGIKNKLEKDLDAETCPYCNAYVPLANLEEHFNIHVGKRGVHLPALEELWKTYLVAVDKVPSSVLFYVRGC